MCLDGSRSFGNLGGAVERRLLLAARYVGRKTESVTMHEISNEELTLADVPAVDASWPEIEAFALTFDGYEAIGSFDALADLAERGDPKTLGECRACLFWEQRSYRWAGYGGAPKLSYAQALVRRIREFLGEGGGGK